MSKTIGDNSQENNKKIILASGSSGRLAILRNMLIEPDFIIVPNVPEPVIKGEKPRQMSIRLATAKMNRAIEMIANDKKINKNSILISGDTVACCGNRVLDKAQNDDDVRRYINIMNGHNSRVFSTVCIVDLPTGRRSIKTVETRLKLKYLQQDEIDFLVSTHQGIGKAGGYSLSGFACCLFEKIVGSYTNVVGLPATQVYNALRSFGYKFNTEKNY